MSYTVGDLLSIAIERARLFPQLRLLMARHCEGTTETGGGGEYLLREEGK